MIQELDWRPSRSLDSLPPADPVKEVLLSFYNSALFRMVVIYDRYKTEELTDQDMVEAISARYGTASRPDATVILFSTFQVYDDSEKVIARWENAQYSFNLFRSSYQPTFGMLIFSKRLDILAQEAIAEAIRLDEQEDPQREIERQKIQGEANQAAQEKARLANKTNFRP
jgi:septin family protein